MSCIVCVCVCLCVRCLSVNVRGRFALRVCMCVHSCACCVSCVIVFSQTLSSHNKLPAQALPIEPAALCSEAAFRFFYEPWRAFHIVAFGERSPLQKHMIGKKPSSKMIRRFLQKRPVDEVQPPSPQTIVAPKLNSLPVDVFIEWIHATRFQKQLRNVKDVYAAWTKIMKRRFRLTDEQIAAEHEHVCYTQLRKARVRLDSVAMLLFRCFFAGLTVATSYNIYLFTDGSPQWRGTELFATSFDLITTGSGEWVHSRRLMPVLKLGIYMATACGKCFAILWKIFLIVGPSFNRIRLFLSRVRSITSDMGVERMIVDLPDVFIQFCHLVGIPVPVGASPCTRLFPRGIQAPDWMHIFDILLRRGLFAAPWFPCFLERLKALLKLLRNHMEDIRSDLDALGLAGVSELLESISLPYFAKWRWKTLHQVCRAIGKQLDTLRQNWGNFKFLQKLRDTTMVKLCQQAMASGEWASEFMFVSWYSAWLTKMQSWGGSCMCHPEAFITAGQSDCKRSGRLLRVAYPYAVEEFAGMQAEIESWPATMANTSHTKLAQYVGIVRMVIALGKEKLSFMNKIPYVHS
jgi:hypothetical protein